MKRSSVFLMAQGAVIAALYVVLTWLSAICGLSSGPIQIRLSEALCILPYFTFTAVPGLTVGCALANLLTGAFPLDILFGSLATLLGALGAYALRKSKRWLSAVPNIAANTIIIPFILAWVYDTQQALPFLFFTVGVGELLSGGVLGMLLFSVVEKNRERLFGKIPPR